VIVAALVIGNDAVKVIEPGNVRRGVDRPVDSDSSTVSKTPTMSFPFPSAATSTGSITSTITRDGVGVAN